jgi:oligosaccharide repeat unit polymerase
MSFLSRGLYQESDSSYVIYKLKRYLITYSSGHLYAFSDWFSERYFSDSTMNYNQEYFTTGFYTFMSAFRYFGDDRIVPMGTYSEFYASGDYIFTNIYTMFRGLISDFTLVGSLVVACFAGFVCNFAYYRLLCERLNPFYILFFVFFVAISYQTYLISTLMWKTIPLVFVVQVGVLFIYFKLNASISRKRNVV